MVGRANGVGPKLAMRLVTELKGKVPAPASASMPACSACRRRWARASRASNVADAVSALSNLGYSSAQASAAVARVVGKEGDSDGDGEADPAGAAGIEQLILAWRRVPYYSAVSKECRESQE